VETGKRRSNLLEILICWCICEYWNITGKKYYLTNGKEISISTDRKRVEQLNTLMENVKGGENTEKENQNMQFIFIIIVYIYRTSF